MSPLFCWRSVVFPWDHQHDMIGNPNSRYTLKQNGQWWPGVRSTTIPPFHCLLSLVPHFSRGRKLSCQALQVLLIFADYCSYFLLHFQEECVILGLLNYTDVPQLWIGYLACKSGTLISMLPTSCFVPDPGNYCSKLGGNPRKELFTCPFAIA